MNNDYKILALIFANRIKTVIDPLIDEAQSGFLKKRHISNNIRLVLDLLDYSYLSTDDGFVLFLDFYKAFDTIEHNFIFKSLEKFGFGNFFCKAIQTMYKNANSSVKLKDGSSSRFYLKRGIRQGCPISPYLFLLCTQIMNVYVRTSQIKGISIAGRNIIISQLADDTALFLKDHHQVQIALNVVEVFSKASGLCLNLRKCELLPINNCNLQLVANIPIKQSVTYLGIVISKDQSSRCNINFDPILKKTKAKLNHWLLRDLSLKGRVLLSKAEGLSRLVYAATSLNVSKELCKAIDTALIFFGKTRHIILENL